MTEDIGRRWKIVFGKTEGEKYKKEEEGSAINTEKPCGHARKRWMKREASSR